MGFSTDFCCVRCGYIREEHNHNLVDEPDEIFLPACEVQPGYELSLVDCVETKLPAEYLAMIEADELYIDNWTHGYVSPDPHKEHALRQEYLDSFMSHTMILIPDRRNGCYRVFSSD